MAKFIKNSDTSNHTWVGQTVLPDEYYELQSHEESSWANNSQLLTDIGSGIAVVAKSDSGTDDITDVNDGINYIKDNIPKIIKQAAILDPQGKRARLTGTHHFLALANTTTTGDWLIPQLQYPAGTNVSSIFDGIEYYAKDSEIGDSLEFSVVDTDGSGVGLGLYPQAVYDTYKDGNGVFVVEKFGESWFVSPNSLEDIILYKAKLYPGLSLRIIYDNTHATNDVKFVCNIFRHLDI